MVLQQKGEVINRGVSMLGELTEAQWNSFEVDSNGRLIPTDLDNFPKSTYVKQLNYYISAVQGNYSPEGRRNYHNFVIARQVMLFKTWMMDYIQDRFRPKWTDGYGKRREGYYTTIYKLTRDYAKLLAEMKLEAIKNKGFKDYELVNLRKMAYDIVMMSFLSLAQAGLEDEEDPNLEYLNDLIAQLQIQLFVQLYPVDALTIISRPFAAMGIVESLVGATTNVLSGNFKKAGSLIYSTAPGHRAIDFSYDFIDMED